VLLTGFCPILASSTLASLLGCIPNVLSASKAFDPGQRPLTPEGTQELSRPCAADEDFHEFSNFVVEMVLAVHLLAQATIQAP